MPGPFSSYEVPDDGTRLKLGSLWVPMRKGLDVGADLDPETGELTSVTLTLAGSIAAVQIFASAKDQDSWTELRYEIAAKLEETHVEPKVVNGAFGPELHAVLPVFDQSGNTSIQSARFMGINGDRWFMRISISGNAATDSVSAIELDELIADLVVDRGDIALAPGERLPLSFPVESDENFDDTQTIHIEL